MLEKHFFLILKLAQWQWTIWKICNMKEIFGVSKFFWIWKKAPPKHKPVNPENITPLLSLASTFLLPSKLCSCKAQPALTAPKAVQTSPPVNFFCLLAIFFQHFGTFLQLSVPASTTPLDSNWSSWFYSTILKLCNAHSTSPVGISPFQCCPIIFRKVSMLSPLLSLPLWCYLAEFRWVKGMVGHAKFAFDVLCSYCHVRAFGPQYMILMILMSRQCWKSGQDCAPPHFYAGRLTLRLWNRFSPSSPVARATV